MASKSVTLTGTFFAICAVPEFPGATKSELHFGLCLSFHAIVCSLPPDPKIKIFIVVMLCCCCFNKNNYLKEFD